MLFRRTLPRARRADVLLAACVTLALTLGPSGPATAEVIPDIEPLPQPLRLQHAVEAVHAMHPRVQQVRARREEAEAELDAARAEGDLRIDARLEARWVEPNDQVVDDRNNDSRATLVARKLLSDFGHSRAREEAGASAVEAARQEEWLAFARHRLEVLERYFDVVLADLAFARDTEAMAAAFVTLERLEERNERGQVSDIDLFEAEAEYQEYFTQRQRSLYRQQRSRAELAEALNHRGRAPADVLAPPLPLDLPEVPDLRSLLAELEADSPALAAQRYRVEAASGEVQAARSERRPRLYAEAETGYWNRDFGGDRNPFAAGLVLEVPLYVGRRSDARVGRAVAQRRQAEADRDQALIEARNRVRELVHEIQTLHVQRDEALSRMDYRDLYISRARYLYEMEDEADLGDSMVQQSAAAHFNARTEFELALAYERLALLTGREDLSPFAAEATAFGGTP